MTHVRVRALTRSAATGEVQDAGCIAPRRRPVVSLPGPRPLVVFNASAPGGCPQGSMAKKDMSFIKMVANDEDFHREVYEHGQENLLVSALPPCVRSSLMRVLMPGAHSRPQWLTSTPSAGGRA